MVDGEAARADRELAGNRRDAGLVTDADVLQLDVHVARTRQQQIRAESDERIACARLNQVMGEPLDSTFTLDLTPAPDALETTALPSLEAEALKNRPDVTLATLQEQLAGAALTAARAAFLPQVAAQGGWELNGGRWGTRASSWVFGRATAGCSVAFRTAGGITSLPEILPSFIRAVPRPT